MLEKENITYGVANSGIDLGMIQALQRKNLPQYISSEEYTKEGFVSIKHDRILLQAMNHPHPHIVARFGVNIIGYTLVMLREMANKIPLLIPMFAQINSIQYEGISLEKSRYFVMGQVCIDKAFRGQGIFQGLYLEMEKRMAPHFDFIITEIAESNPRSLRAHEKVGFQRIKNFHSDGVDWVIVLLDIRI